jgi:hypothetical protein
MKMEGDQPKKWEERIDVDTEKTFWSRLDLYTREQIPPTLIKSPRIHYGSKSKS